MKFLTPFVLIVTTIVFHGNDNPVFASPTDFSEASQELDIDPEIIESSPVIQEWIQEIPDLSAEIRNQRNFPTLVRLGYSQFPSSNQSGGILLGVEDLFIGNSSLSLSGEYVDNFRSNSENNRSSIGGNLNYYLLPLGSYVNIAPTLGYQSIETGTYQTDGVNVGIKLILALSPQGAADVSISQSFISPTSNDEVGITEVQAGYAVTEKIRVFAGISWQNTIANDDSQVNLGLEWMP